MATDRDGTEEEDGDLDTITLRLPAEHLRALKLRAIDMGKPWNVSAILRDLIARELEMHQD